MAWYEVTHSCGHTERHQLIGPHKSREWRISCLEGELCQECFEAKRAEENTKAAEENRELGLPELKGSQKQIQWAETIRKAILEALEERFKEVEDATDEQKREYFQALDVLMAKESASWWIDHRDAYMPNVLGECLKEAKLRTTPAIPTTDAEIESRAEATIRPENPQTETVAEFSITSDSIFVDFPEKRDSFREIMKNHGFKWVGSKWQRTPDKFAGKVSDRVAQTASALLDGRYIVRVFDKDIRDVVRDRSFQPEQKCWIKAFIDDKKFTIKWPYGMDFYDKAKKIPGSKWDSSRRVVIVPSEQYEQVLDFAEVYNFGISDGAKRLAEEADKIKYAALTVAPVSEQATQKTDPMSIPEEGFMIDDSLRDKD